MRTALVTDAARGSAIAVIRSLDRAGWRVIAADSERSAPGRFSRSTAAWVRYPDPRRAPRSTIDALVEAVGRHGVDLVFPVTDDVIVPLLDRRDELEQRTVVALPTTAALRSAADKDLVTELARRCGVPVPRTVRWCPGHDEPVASLGLSWPVVVKPARSRTLDTAADARIAAHEVRYAADGDELRATLAAAAGPVLLQERVEGVGQGVEVLARDGEVVAAFQHRRLREYPPSGGASSFREAVPVDDELLELSGRLLRELDWSGLAMVEFKSGPSGHHLMEINGRVWGSLPLAVAAGVDFPALAAALHVGEPVAPVTGARYGTRSRNVELELKWAGAVLARHRLGALSGKVGAREAAAVVARLATRPSDGYDVLDRRDPLPGLVDVVRSVGSTVRGAVA